MKPQLVVIDPHVIKLFSELAHTIVSRGAARTDSLVTMNIDPNSVITLRVNTGMRGLDFRFTAEEMSGFDKQTSYVFDYKYINAIVKTVGDDFVTFLRENDETMVLQISYGADVSNPSDTPVILRAPLNNSAWIQPIYERVDAVLQQTDESHQVTLDSIFDAKDMLSLLQKYVSLAEINQYKAIKVDKGDVFIRNNVLILRRKCNFLDGISLSLSELDMQLLQHLFSYVKDIESCCYTVHTSEVSSFTITIPANNTDIDLQYYFPQSGQMYPVNDEIIDGLIDETKNDAVSLICGVKDIAEAVKVLSHIPSRAQNYTFAVNPDTMGVSLMIQDDNGLESQALVGVACEGKTIPNDLTFFLNTRLLTKLVSIWKSHKVHTLKIHCKRNKSLYIEGYEGESIGDLIVNNVVW